MIISSLALLVSLAGPLTTALVNRSVEDWYAAKLTFRTNELVLVNGRVVDVRIKNEGKGLAKDISVVVDAYFPGFKFTDQHHVHTSPNMDYVRTISGGRLVVKLTSPLAAGQEVMVLVDELAMEEPNKQTSIFTGLVTTDRGQAVPQGAAFRSFPTMTLDQYLGRMEEEIRRLNSQHR